MRRTLLVTNDFPPRAGGIQSYVQSLAERLPADELVVYAPSWSGAADFDATQPFPVYRHPGSLMLPGPRGAPTRSRTGAGSSVSSGLVRRGRAVEPAHSRAAGRGRHPDRASTHGHEVGWSMLPGARQRAAPDRPGPTTSSPSSASTRGGGSRAPSDRTLRWNTCRPACASTPSVRIRRRDGGQGEVRLGRRAAVAVGVPAGQRKGQDSLIRAVPRS